MVRTYQPKHGKTAAIPNDTVKDALKLIKNGSSIRKAAKELGISESGLRGRMKKENQEGPVSKPRGGQPSLSVESEIELSHCLRMKFQLGFSSTREEVTQFVKNYVLVNKTKNNAVGEHIRKYCQFKNDAPGPDWLRGFIKRYDLSTTIEKSRKAASSNTELSLDDYRKVEEEVEDLAIQNCLECILNFHETSPCNQSQAKVIEPKFQ